MRRRRGQAALFSSLEGKQHDASWSIGCAAVGEEQGSSVGGPGWVSRFIVWANHVGKFSLRATQGWNEEDGTTVFIAAAEGEPVERSPLAT